MNPKDFNADTHFYELTELADLSLQELQTLWDTVPSEEQAYLTRVFEREADKRQVVEDLDEARMARYFLEQYREIGFVPAGDVWVKVPVSIREQYKLPLVTVADEEANASSGEITSNKKIPTKTGLPKWIFLMAVPFACLIIFAVIRVATGASQSDDSQETAILPSDTPSPTATLSPTPTATPLPPTATPFALSGFDDAISAGNRASREYYPVQLQVFANRDTLPRVFIVQEQAIGVAEWRFDSNPDVVSWLGRMLIRPVLGVPFSTGNLDLFRSLTSDSVFAVTMNTGNVLQFVFQDMKQVGRADTSFFRQDTPGLVLVLIGETFADGSPTDLRYLVRAEYPTGQELGALSTDTRPIIPMQTVHTISNLSISIQAARLIVSPNLPSDLAYAVLDIQLVSDETAVPTNTLTWLLELTTESGERFLPDTNAATFGNCAPLEQVIASNTATCASIGFVVSRYATDARLFVGNSPEEMTVFEVELTSIPMTISSSDLDVQLGRISYTNTTLTIRARIFNPTDRAISLPAADFSLVLGFVPNPTGMAISPIFETRNLEPSSMLDVVLDFPYAGEGFGMLTMLGRVWGIEVK
jgi:hypothetical protein